MIDWGQHIQTQAAQREARDSADEIGRLRRELAMALDAAAKGDLARQNAGGMELRIRHLEARLAEAEALLREWYNLWSKYTATRELPPLPLEFLQRNSAIIAGDKP